MGTLSPVSHFLLLLQQAAAAPVAAAVVVPPAANVPPLPPPAPVADNAHTYLQRALAGASEGSVMAQELAAAGNGLSNRYAVEQGRVLDQFFAYMDEDEAFSGLSDEVPDISNPNRTTKRFFNVAGGVVTLEKKQLVNLAVCNLVRRMQQGRTSLSLIAPSS